MKETVHYKMHLKKVEKEIKERHVEYLRQRAMKAIKNDT